MEVLENLLSGFYTTESRLQQVEQFATINNQNSQSVKFITSSHAGSQHSVGMTADAVTHCGLTCLNLAVCSFHHLVTVVIPKLSMQQAVMTVKLDRQHGTLLLTGVCVTRPQLSNNRRSTRSGFLEKVLSMSTLDCSQLFQLYERLCSTSTTSVQQVL